MQGAGVILRAVHALLILLPLSTLIHTHGALAAGDADPAAGGGLFEGLALGGYIKNETAFRFREPRSITKIRNILHLDADWAITRDYRLFASAWAYHDLAYEFFDYQTISARFARDEDQPLVFIDNLAEERDSNVAEFRELYLDMFYDRVDVRLGKQFVVWGVFEGIRITDEINPLDFRELILPDLLDYRIPLWMARVDWYGESGDLQFLWIPELEFHRPAPAGSEWELLQEITDPDGNVVTRYPSQNFRNSEFGLRYTTRLFETDMGFSFLYTWDDFPVLFRTALIDSAVEPTLFPTFTRINMYGMTAVRPTARGVVKFEATFVPDKYFGLKNDTDRDGDGFLDSQGVLRKRHLRWGLGYDFSRWGADFSPAITQWVILDHDDQLIQDRFDTSLTLFVRKPVPRHSLVLQLLAIGLLNMDELYLKPELVFNVSDHFQIGTGLDLFFGERSRLGISGAATPILGGTSIEQSPQFFGNFNRNDRIFAEFRYTFRVRR